MSDVLFRRRDSLVAAFHAQPPAPRAGPRKTRGERLFDLIVAINARLLERGRIDTFNRMRAIT